ncbi:uncharacterized protein LOC131468685 isoform X2 [Solea solea]|uniref:uncharacterized protein LOC131468685 isoform X2 n=1 Tax=Solea solea TaxID=90069 RepID=UPI00272B81DD|nr:uncharacterized protein LOC131468685 isoform X2 [Solea solea]
MEPSEADAMIKKTPPVEEDHEMSHCPPVPPQRLHQLLPPFSSGCFLEQQEVCCWEQQQLLWFSPWSFWLTTGCSWTS